MTRTASCCCAAMGFGYSRIHTNAAHLCAGSPDVVRVPKHHLSHATDYCQTAPKITARISGMTNGIFSESTAVEFSYGSIHTNPACLHVQIAANHRRAGHDKVCP